MLSVLANYSDPSPPSVFGVMWHPKFTNLRGVSLTLMEKLR